MILRSSTSTLFSSSTLFFFFLIIRRPPRSPFFPYPTLFRSARNRRQPPLPVRRVEPLPDDLHLFLSKAPRGGGGLLAADQVIENPVGEESPPSPRGFTKEE